mgnify:CR=1 FL=1
MTIEEGSDLVGKRIHELTGKLGSDNVLMGVVSKKGTIRKPHHRETFEELQILVLKISPDDVAGVQTEFGLSLDPDLEDQRLQGEMGVIEAMITPRSRLIGRRFNYFKRMRNHPSWNTKNICSWDLSIEGAKELNTFLIAQPKIFYFSSESFSFINSFTH